MKVVYKFSGPPRILLEVGERSGMSSILASGSDERLLLKDCLSVTSLVQYEFKGTCLI